MKGSGSRDVSLQMTMPWLIYASDPQTPRLRVRRVDETRAAELVRNRAVAQNRFVVDVFDGGSVANRYGYPAETECVLVIAGQCGNAVIWCGRARANKVTRRSAAMACLPSIADIFVADLFDLRVNDNSRKARAMDRLISLFHSYWTPILRLASVAD